MNVIRMSILREPSSFSLFRREEPILHFRYLIESLGHCLAGFSHNTILQLICRIVRSPSSILNRQLHADFDQLFLKNGSGLIKCWSNFGFVCFQRFTRHTEADPPPGTQRWEAEVNITRTYPLWLSSEGVARLRSVLILPHTASMVVATAVPTVSGVRCRSEDQNRNSGKSFQEENHR
jgi:hypothetical protein